MDPADALARANVDRLLDPAPIEWRAVGAARGRRRLRRGADRHAGVTGPMVDWWFDWHADDPIRYRIWHPLAHQGNSIEPAGTRAARQGALGRGPPSRRGHRNGHASTPASRSDDLLEMGSSMRSDPAIATIVGGFAGDDARHIQHTPMFHVFIAHGDGVLSAAASGSERRCVPTDPSAGCSRPLNNHRVRRALIPASGTAGARGPLHRGVREPRRAAARAVRAIRAWPGARDEQADLRPGALSSARHALRAYSIPSCPPYS